MGETDGWMDGQDAVIDMLNGLYRTTTSIHRITQLLKNITNMVYNEARMLLPLLRLTIWLTLYGPIKTAEQRTIIQQYGDWYTGR